MKKRIILNLLTFASILAGVILAIFAYACKSFTCMVFSLFSFLLSAYFATALDDALKHYRKNR
ncbi:MAG: hypothetical protein IKR38_03010 [Bacteroidales bacterium]|nr:hypothetical protein [Bacteroidales bacterium]